MAGSLLCCHLGLLSLFLLGWMGESVAQEASCPMEPMCAVYCEEYFHDERGCMTCDCVITPEARHVAEGGDDDRAAPVYPPQCPMPMCAQFCKEYATDDKGCMTCTCAPGSNDSDAPEKHESERCEGDEEWTDCGASCTATCADPVPVCPRDCVPGCRCPATAPVRDDGGCITADECEGSDRTAFNEIDQLLKAYKELEKIAKEA